MFETNVALKHGLGLMCHTGFNYTESWAIVPTSAYMFGAQPNGVQVDPHLGFLGSPRGQCSSSRKQAE